MLDCLISILKLLVVAFMPILQVLIISGLGAFMATPSVDLLPVDARRSLNQIVFRVFTPCLTLASLAQTVNFKDIVSWWFMPINVGLTFLFGALLGNGLVKLVKPEPHIRGLVIASCSAGNLGNLVLILIPAICQQDGSPFVNHDTCKTVGLSYTALSMAIGGLCMWTFTYQLVRNASVEYIRSRAVGGARRMPNTDQEADQETGLLEGQTGDQQPIQQLSIHNQLLQALNETQEQQTKTCYHHLTEIIKELKAPPTIGAILGLIFGAVPWLHHLVIGDHASLRVLHDCAELLGHGTIPCITLIMGGNLIEGLRSGKLEKGVILGVIIVKYLFLPLIGMGVVFLASRFGFLSADPLYHFVLMVQFTLPPAMNIGTMTQLFDVGQKECSVLFIWTYSVAAFALTIWCTIYMWLLS